METKTIDRPKSRWGHTLTTYENDLFLIGGRNKNLVYDHVYEFSTDKKKWSLVKKLDFGIYSHSTVCWKGFLIINGGLKDFSKCQVNRDLILIQPEAFGSSLRQVPNLPNHYFGRFAHTSHITGKSLSEALILASINPKYDYRLFIELQVQYMKITSSEHVLFRSFLPWMLN